MLIKKDNRKANRYLSILSFLLSLWLLDTFFRVADIFGQNPDLYFLPIYFSFAFGPFIYFYTLSITQTRKLSFREKFIHLLPAFLQGLLYTYLQVRNYEFRLFFWLEIHKPYTYDLELAFSFISLLAYLYLCRKHLKTYKVRIENNFSDIHKIALRWLNQLQWVLFLVSLFWLLETLARVTWGFYAATPLSSITMGAIIILIAVGGLLQIDLKATIRQTELVEEPQQIILTNEELNQLDTIQNTMMHDQLFLRPELSLKEFAAHLQLSTRETSRLINQGLQMSFIDFVNQYRVNHFKSIVTQDNVQHLSLLGIALESGFNSKATFNRVFKKMEGKSPSEFIKASQNTN